MSILYEQPGKYDFLPIFHRRQLKSLATLHEEFDFHPTLDGDYEDRGQNWLINESMVPYFGDGKWHNFRPLSPNDTAMGYTHTMDSYYYHHLWFEEYRDKLIIELDDTDFML